MENGLWSEVLNTGCNLYVEANKESKMKFFGNVHKYKAKTATLFLIQYILIKVHI